MSTSVFFIMKVIVRCLKLASKLTGLVVQQLFLSRSFFKLSPVNHAQSQTISLHAVRLESIRVTCFSEISFVLDMQLPFLLTGRPCVSNNLEREFNVRKT